MTNDLILKKRRETHQACTHTHTHTEKMDICKSKRKASEKSNPVNP
jgi:hypothetical protein